VRVVLLDKKSILGRYQLDKLLALPCVVVVHRNAVEYLDGVNPIVLCDMARVRRAVAVWNDLIDEVAKISKWSPPRTMPKRLVALGYVYPDTYAVSSSLPRIPYIPDVFGVVVNGEPHLIDRRGLENPRRTWAEILRRIARYGVIVKPCRVVQGGKRYS